MIATATEDETIESLKGVEDDVRISHRRDNHRDTTSSHYGFVVTLSKFTGLFGIIARDADNRLIGGLRITGVDCIETAL